LVSSFFSPGRGERQPAMADPRPEGEAGSDVQDGVGGVTEPERLFCPITHTIYRDPCFVPESGNTYERAAVEEYWSSTPRPRDPLTNMDLQSRVLHTNWGVRREVQRFLDDHPGYVPNGWTKREVPLPAGSAEGTVAGAGQLSARALSSRRVGALLAVVVALLVGLVVRHQMPVAPLGRHGPPGNATVLHQPKGSRLQAWTEGDHLVVHLPPQGVGVDQVAEFCFACFWTGFTTIWTIGAVRSGAPVMFAMFSLPFFGVGISLLRGAAKAPFRRQYLDLGTTDYKLSTEWFRFVFSSATYLIADLSSPPILHCDGKRCELVFEDGVQEIVFASSSLWAAEAKWVQDIVKSHLVKTPKGSRFDVQLPEQSMPSQPRRNSRTGGGPYGDGAQTGLFGGHTGGLHVGVTIR